MAGLKERLGVADLTAKNIIWRAVLAEFIGNLLLNFFGCGSCVNIDPKAGAISHVLIGLCFGLVIMAVVQSIGHVSGGHINPAVTCGMLVTGNITIIKGFLYIIAQCLGAMAGSAVLKALTPEAVQGNLGTTTLGKNVTAVQGLGIEFFLAFILLFVIFGVCDSNKPETKAITPMVIGLTAAMCIMVAVDYTGGSINPARSLGSAVISNIWDNHWVYWLGPILGGVAASLIYHHAFTAPSIDSQNEYSPVQLKRLDNRKDEDGTA